MSKYILAFDQGTTSSRAIVFDHAGAIIAIAQKEFTQIFPQPAWVEHDAEEIWSTQIGVAAEAITKAGATTKDIAAIGITNQRETTVVWNRKTGKPVYTQLSGKTGVRQLFVINSKTWAIANLFNKKPGLSLMPISVALSCSGS